MNSKNFKSSISVILLLIALFTQSFLTNQASFAKQSQKIAASSVKPQRETQRKAKIEAPVLPSKFDGNKANSKKLKNNSLTLGKSSKKFIFTGCAGEEAEFEEVAKVMTMAEEAWNKHQVDELLKYYIPNFLSKDGLDLDKIRNNLTEFWVQYPDAKIESLPTSIYVCGEYATANLTETTTGTGQMEDAKVIPYKSQFKALIQGITTLKKSGGLWQISSEEILSEDMQKSYGPVAKQLLDDGRLKLVIPKPIKEGENYIAQLKYSLPEQIQAVALIDKILLNENDKNSKEDTESKAIEENIEAIRRNIEGRDPEGLRRLFTFNNAGEDELVRAQVELVAFNKKGPVLVGILGISQRVVSKGVSADPKGKEKSNKIVKQTLKEEHFSTISKKPSAE
jgi:hypothetical protein